jgi:hypothetical protein
VVSGGVVQSVYVSKDISNKFGLGIEVEITDFDEDGLKDDRCIADELTDLFDNNMTAIY